jgi:predicted membrane-bound dolichyl-phosphate-mannose-protein mannosyltransferase
MKKNKLIVFGLLLIFFLQATFSMREKSGTSDETPHLLAGYAYLKTRDYRLNFEHPPLVKMFAAVPLLFLNLSFSEEDEDWQRSKEEGVRQWVFGRRFLYQNRIPGRKILFWGRIPMIILGVLLGFLVFLWARELYGDRAGLAALFLYAFSPNILAHSRFVTTDLAVSLFMFLAIYTLWRGNFLLSGLSLGLALSTKYTAIILFPTLGTLLFYLCSQGKIRISRAFLWFLAMILIAILTIFLSYQMTGLGYYLKGLRYIIWEAAKRGHPSFLVGNYSSYFSGGWPHYFLVAFLLKTPIPIIILTVFSLFCLRKKDSRREENITFLLVPIFLIFFFASLSKKQIGLRYILPAYPFLFVWVSKGITQLSRKKIQRLFLLLLAVWYSYSSLSIYPHYLAYFNELIGGPKNGYHYLVDSNLDWGQDLIGLKKYLEKEGNPEIIFSYYGTADPHQYGIKYQGLFYKSPLKTDRKIKSLKPEREFLAISVNNLQGVFYEDHHLFAWLKEYEPVKKIGYSIFIYDITNNPDAYFQIGAIYWAQGKWEEAERSFKRIQVITPQEERGYLLLGKLYQAQGRLKEAEEEFKKASRGSRETK